MLRSCRQALPMRHVHLSMVSLTWRLRVSKTSSTGDFFLFFETLSDLRHVSLDVAEMRTCFVHAEMTHQEVHSKWETRLRQPQYEFALAEKNDAKVVRIAVETRWDLECND